MNGNFKARCINSNGVPWWTRNKVYEVVNGYITDDEGDKSRNRYNNIRELNQVFVAEFELVEDSKLDRFAKGEIALNTPTQEIYDKLMQWCEDKGLTWSNGANALSRKNWDRYKHLTCMTHKMKLQYSESKGIGYADYDFYEEEDKKIETLSLSDFGEPTPEPTPEPLSITIEFNGRETVARLIKNGKTVKQAVAKCLPTDKFSEAVGSQLALARLFEKKQKDIPTPSYKEVKRRAKVGEWVKVVSNNGHYFTLGNIVKCTISHEAGEFGEFASNNYSQTLEPCEYVVLEGYNHVQ